MKPYTRREFLDRLIVGISATRWIAPVAAQSPSAKRVIIVGAGLAGLSAAYELNALNHEVTVFEAQTRPGGRVQTLRDPFDDGLFAEAGASRIPTSHDLTLGYARKFGLTLIPFEPPGVPSVRYAYGQRSRVQPDTPFEWPSGIAADQKRLTPAEIRRRYIVPLTDQITDPFSPAWMPESLRRYDRVTRDEYLRAQGLSEAALHMMNLGYTPVARYRSFLDVLHENAVNRELSRRAGTELEQALKIEGGNDRLPRAFADRLAGRIRYGCPVHRIEHDTRGVRVFFRNGQSVESSEADYVVCAIPFSTLKSVAFSTALTPQKRSAIDGLPYESVTRIYLQSRERYWTREGLSGCGRSRSAASAIVTSKIRSRLRLPCLHRAIRNDDVRAIPPVVALTRERALDQRVARRGRRLGLTMNLHPEPPLNRTVVWRQHSFQRALA